MQVQLPRDTEDMQCCSVVQEGELLDRERSKVLEKRNKTETHAWCFETHTVKDFQTE